MATTGDGARVGPSPAEEAVLAAVDEAWMLEALGPLVAVPSWRGREREAQKYVAGLMAEMGLSLDVWEINEDELRKHPDYASEIKRADPLGVVGRCTWGEGGPTLVLNGHVDVVPPGDLGRWTTPPFAMDERDGRLYGRGVLDMKGPLIAALAGVRAVLDAGSRPGSGLSGAEFPSPVVLRGSVLVHSVVGEEDGGLGTLATVLRGHVGDGAVVLEPTGLSVATAQAGALNFRLTVPGRAAHGAVRHEGVSALEKFMLVHDDLIAFERERNRRVDDPRFRAWSVPWPICIGTVRGGEWASSVPEVVRAEGRFGLAPAEDVEEARRAFKARVASCCRGDRFLRNSPVEVEWWGGQFAPCETSPDERIVRVATGVARDLGLGDRNAAAGDAGLADDGGVASDGGGAASADGGGAGSPEVVGVPYGSDLRHLVNAGGMPGVLFGPGEIAGAHREDESIAVAELVDAARAVALTVVRFLG